MRDTALGAAEAVARRCGCAADRPAAVAARLVTLFGTRAAAACGAAVHRVGCLPGTDIPRAAVEFCVREEWARTIDDVVERRLMLAFEPGLGHAVLVEVAAILADLGLVPPGDVPAVADGCAARLAARYDKHLPRTGVVDSLPEGR